ncbi:SDR family NAD(P)-dependent oxidoreductase [Acinetobacter lactucae]|jgi:NAD(P)-dependent dehydrogenase (short-subunit alcohol dehydrogenase family)|uniref:SDR family NAD(P)-dependent oxidoreductase n=1 Tax=Acinetobacter lactucae TaxID=1785128 RepID=A0ABS1ALP9_9GAMM|nr:SDR family NAD(P)-dependent oxidoreductase [Acinetobacter lactucae]MBJ8438844.1 SDR family NAD(P)-dependent oxidoreductase [Acinetobacter lactucae]
MFSKLLPTSKKKKKYLNKILVVTGAGSGFGREIALLFAQHGAIIIGVDINLATAEKTAEEVRQLGVTAYAKQVDVGNLEQMEAFAAWVHETVGAPDIVVNNAGIGMGGAFLDTTSENWSRIFNVNLWSVIHSSRLFAQQMVDAKKSGHIVNMASMAAYTPSRTTAAYATTKAAVRMFSDCIRAELADYNIHVSTIFPGFSTTGIINNTQFVGASAEQQAAIRNKVNKLYSLRSLPPVRIAEAVLAAVDYKQPEIPVGIESAGMKILSRVSPSLVRYLARFDPTPH